MRNSRFLWIIIAILLLLDIYIFQVVKVLTAGSSSKVRLIVFILYWLISLLSIGVLLALPYINFEALPKGFRTYIFAIIISLFFSKLLASIFFAIDDIRRGSMWVVSKLFSNPSVEIKTTGDGITRSTFLSWLGMAVGGTFLGTMFYGFTNKYNYNIKRVALAFNNLPANFKGLKVVHISDIHAGSFMDKSAVQNGVDKILAEKPDLIFFTGDLVNDHAREMDDYIEIFKKLSAPMGVYSTLGNHDYGEYALPQGLSQMERVSMVADNVKKVQAVHQQLGWRLLMNENIQIEKDGQSISLIGVENWSMKGNFPKYGKLDLAHAGTDASPFKILLSHDPSHWDGEVKKRFSDIDLMLSGHTHGMQFGVEIPGFKWSPVQYMYRQWAGLYEDAGQKLYINRGFGFIGYPGRVGILPEITVLEFS